MSDLPYTMTTETLTAAGRSVAFTRVAEPDDVLDVAARENHVEPPYWATIWPSGRALAAWAGQHVKHGQRVLDLGCGSGIVGCAALLAGARVTLADWEPAALELARANAEAAGGEFDVRRVDWHTDTLPGRYDLILAADVMYEPAMGAAVLDFCQRHVGEGGQIVLADPNRRHADAVAALVHTTGGTLLPFPGGRILVLQA